MRRTNDTVAGWMREAGMTVQSAVFGNLSSQRARRISPEDCDAFDYVLTMDEENYRAVASLCRGSAVVRPFLDFAHDLPEREIPDLYYGGPDGFDHVLDLVEEASEGLLADIREWHLSHLG